MTNKTISQNYYVYYYLRSQDSLHGSIGTPYYVGKGKGNRINDSNHSYGPPKDSKCRVKVAENLCEEQATQIEMLHIKLWGRIDLGTGILRNQTDGGDGAPGRKASLETLAKMSESQKLAHKCPLTKEKRRKSIKESFAKPESIAKRKALFSNSEFQEKRRAAIKATYNDPAFKENLKKLRKAVGNRPDVKAKNSAAQKIAQNKPEVKSKRDNAIALANSQPEVRQKRSQSAKEMNNRPEFKKKQRESLAKTNQLPDVKLRRSLTNKQTQLRLLSEGKHHSQIQHTCPHCGKTGYGSNMKRHHFDKCKLRVS